MICHPNLDQWKTLKVRCNQDLGLPVGPVDSNEAERLELCSHECQEDLEYIDVNATEQQYLMLVQKAKAH